MPRAPEPPAHDQPAGARRRRVLRVRASGVQVVEDQVATEVPVALAYNGEPFVVMMATPADLHDFALGFSLTEGIVDHAGEIELLEQSDSLEGVALSLRIPPARAQALLARRRNLQGRSGCGICGAESVESVLRTPPVLPESAVFRHAAVHRAATALQAMQPINAATGAVHAAGFADASGQLLAVREDVGRHNALDKLVGALARAGIEPATGFAVVTSRASYEMAMKTAQAGIPLLAAISAPTTLAIALANSARLTLVGFARDAGHAVYANAQRLEGALHAPTP